MRIKSVILLLLLVILTATFAQRRSAPIPVPIFIQTGDELFEIKGAPQLEDGYSVGYACKRLALFGADLRTWDCELMAINISEFSVGDLDATFKTEMESQYSLRNRQRGFWNQYGKYAYLILIGSVLANRFGISINLNPAKDKTPYSTGDKDWRRIGREDRY